jgi:hypothetical protein
MFAKSGGLFYREHIPKIKFPFDFLSQVIMCSAVVISIIDSIVPTGS